MAVDESIDKDVIVDQVERDQSDATEIIKLLHRPRSAHTDKLIAVRWIVAPIDAKPARRTTPAKSAARRPDNL